MEIDLLLKDVVGPTPNTEREVPDEIFKLVQDGPLAEALGGHDNLSKYRAETAHDTARFAKLDHGARPGFTPAAPARRESELRKRAGERNDFGENIYTKFLTSHMAKTGGTAREAFTAWCQQFPRRSADVEAAMHEAAAMLDA